MIRPERISPNASKKAIRKAERVAYAKEMSMRACEEPPSERAAAVIARVLDPANLPKRPPARAMP